MSSWFYRCERCGHLEPSESRAWRCPGCGAALAIEGMPRLAADDIDRGEPGLWRYRAVLPVERGASLSLGESMTPLVPGTLMGQPVRFKLDALLPTGSFKDRGAAVLVAHLRELGVGRVVVDSSGNAAAAMAGYCAKAGLGCTIYAPATTSPAKLVQAWAFGADVVAVEGTRDDVARAAQEAASRDAGAFYASHNWHPVFVEGVKTWLLEVWEQLGRRLPVACFVPTGGGSALVGAARACAALGAATPLVAAQPAACAPIVAAFERGTEIAPVVPGDTIAEGTRIGSPARPRQIARAITESAGWATAVSEAEIVAALRELWRQGLYVEPTAAVAAAACRSALASGRTLPDGEIVVLLTGSGLKATQTIARILDAGNASGSPASE